MSLAAMEEGTFVFHDSTVDPGEVFTTAVDGENEITTRYAFTAVLLVARAPRDVHTRTLWQHTMAMLKRVFFVM